MSIFPSNKIKEGLNQYFFLQFLSLMRKKAHQENPDKWNTPKSLEGLKSIYAAF